MANTPSTLLKRLINVHRSTMIGFEIIVFNLKDFEDIWLLVLLEGVDEFFD